MHLALAILLISLLPPAVSTDPCVESSGDEIAALRQDVSATIPYCNCTGAAKECIEGAECTYDRPCLSWEGENGRRYIGLCAFAAAEPAEPQQQ